MIKIFQKKKKAGLVAQTATELAIFGAILIFVLGIIVRSSVNFNYAQKLQLTAMRQALAWSYISGQDVTTDRKKASLILMEDRQDVNPSLYGSQERNAYTASANATFTKNLFLTADYGVDSVPVLDFLINGQRFPLSVAKFKSIVVAKFPYYSSGGLCHQPEYGGPITACNGLESVEVNARGVHDTDHCHCNMTESYAGSPGLPYINWRWKDRCVYMWGNNAYPVGCALFLAKITKVGNGDGADRDPRWCSTESDCLSSCSCPAGATIDQNCSQCAKPGCLCHLWQRYDFNKNGRVDAEESDTSRFSWQWYRFAGTTYTVNFEGSLNTAGDIDHDGKEEPILGVRDNKGTFWLSFVPRRGKDVFENLTLAEGPPYLGESFVHPYQKNQYPTKEASCDAVRFSSGACAKECDEDDDQVSDDAKLDTVKKVTHCEGDEPIVEFFVLDYQDGDWDTTYDDTDKTKIPYKPSPGLLSDQLMYTYVRSPKGIGNFVVKEDKQYPSDSGKQYLRQSQRNDRVDIIERRIQLSNDTGRLCGGYPSPICCCPGGASSGACTANTPSTGSQWKNPLVCGSGNCFTQGNISKNCFDRSTKILYVRSHIRETRGRRFITDVSSDGIK